MTGRAGPSGRSTAAHVLALPVRCYRAFFAGRPSHCRFQPTCSQYALDAFESHGAWRGSRMAARRILRCRPGGPFGFDPVPLVDRRPAEPSPT